MRAKRRHQMAYQNGPNAGKKPVIKKAWEKPNSLLAALLKDYFKTCSLHGLRYITEESYHWSERCLWAVLSVLALYGVSYGCSVIWEQFQTSPTNTALESTNYAIMNIPFPSVTICTKNHVYWDKVIEFQKQNLSNASNETIEKFHLLMTALATMTFGDFDMIVMPQCKELFVDPCWWRNMDYNCCDLFELQRTEEGFCYSFNSEISNTQVKRASGFNWSVKGAEEVPKSTSPETPRPRRTSNSGEWSGLRAEVRLSPEQIPPLLKSQVPNSLQELYEFLESPQSFLSAACLLSSTQFPPPFFPLSVGKSCICVGYILRCSFYMVTHGISGLLELDLTTHSVCTIGRCLMLRRMDYDDEADILFVKRPRFFYALFLLWIHTFTEKLAQNRNVVT
ncbi:unnamed protein product [Timema podura]|uniref:Uncharacterized protein n=1 Tax=Timema podura TaxID=61482 RepID=A0ABN7NN42_TIMPD|nr:unnamed protein product [Timema podura]